MWESAGAGAVGLRSARPRSAMGLRRVGSEG